ncbi:hypothetical protein [Salisediminibacterium beveridgei]|uniref:Uncharacterized protein n=1 Tax=Salisediminibacterium beveridgei TaxID=632773 RepID=A0A1D7QZB9_9BACI|nr:hypothetical protein [Salisediminibacterium beveridgei]AOM84345.1 hypothetical protein BBEV_3027 [Salisediminibacterium beveridgei]
MNNKRTIWLMVTGLLALGVLIGTLITGPAGAFGPGSGMNGFPGGDLSDEERQEFFENRGSNGEGFGMHGRNGMMGSGMMGLSEEELEEFYEERGFEGTQFHRRGMGMGGFSKERHEEMIEWMEENEGSFPCHGSSENSGFPGENDAFDGDDAR